MGEQPTQANNFSTRGKPPRVMPVVYQQDPHTPPPAIRQAEYAAGIRPASCPCEAHGCGTQGCNSGCSTGCAIVGPRDEYLCDGGDDGLTVGIRKDWQVDGLEQEDTIAHYDTVDGRTVVTPSNQVCIYAPRFGVVRRMVDLHEYARADMPGGIDSPLGLAKIDENERASTSLAQLEPTIHRVGDPATLMRERQQLGELERALVVEEIDGSLAPYADLQIVRAGTIDNGEKALLARAKFGSDHLGWRPVASDFDQRTPCPSVGSRCPAGHCLSSARSQKTSLATDQTRFDRGRQTGRGDRIHASLRQHRQPGDGQCHDHGQSHDPSRIRPRTVPSRASKPISPPSPTPAARSSCDGKSTSQSKLAKAASCSSSARCDSPAGNDDCRMTNARMTMDEGTRGFCTFCTGQLKSVFSWQKSGGFDIGSKSQVLFRTWVAAQCPLQNSRGFAKSEG